jgi:hypothetical protein
MMAATHEVFGCEGPKLLLGKVTFPQTSQRAQLFLALEAHFLSNRASLKSEVEQRTRIEPRKELAHSRKERTRDWGAGLSSACPTHLCPSVLLRVLVL